MDLERGHLVVEKGFPRTRGDRPPENSTHHYRRLKRGSPAHAGIDRGCVS